jgi:hypothetical protein
MHWINREEEEAIYTHTTFGSIVYQRNVVEMAQYVEHLEKMQNAITACLSLC